MFLIRTNSDDVFGSMDSCRLLSLVARRAIHPFLGYVLLHEELTPFIIPFPVKWPSWSSRVKECLPLCSLVVQDIVGYLDSIQNLLRKLNTILFTATDVMVLSLDCWNLCKCLYHCNATEIRNFFSLFKYQLSMEETETLCFSKWNYKPYPTPWVEIFN